MLLSIVVGSIVTIVLSVTLGAFVVSKIPKFWIKSRNDNE